MIDVDINPAGTRLAWIEDDAKDGAYRHSRPHDGKNSSQHAGTLPKTKLWAVKWAN